MKRLVAIGLLVVLAVSLAPVAALADQPVRIYAGISDTLEELEFSVEVVGDDRYQVFRGVSTGSNENVLLTLRGKRIYKGNVLTNANVLFTIKDNHIIPHLDSREANAAFTLRDGRVYSGMHTTPDNILYTFDEGVDRGRLYRGISTTSDNVVFTIDGHMEEILLLLPILADPVQLSSYCYIPEAETVDWIPAVDWMPAVAAKAAQRSRIYNGIADTREELAFSVKDAGAGKYQVYEGFSTGNSNDILLTLKGGRIYQGKTLTNDNVLFTIEGDSIIPGVDSRQANAVYTVQDGRVYEGNVTTPDNILYTFEGADRGRLYKGNSKQLSNVVFTVDGDMDAVLFLLPVLADDTFLGEALGLPPSVSRARKLVRLYNGIADTREELAFSVKDAGAGKYQVYEGFSTGNSNDILLTLKGDRIYQGKTLTNDNVLFTIEGDSIIPGVDSRQANAVYTVQDGRVYEGNVTTPDNILYTFEGADRGRLYKGNSKQLSNVVFTVDGDMDAILFLLPVLADDTF